MANEQGPTFGFGFDGDEQSARTEADRMAAIITKGLTDAFARIGPQLGKSIAKSLKGSGVKQSLEELQAANKRFADASAKHSQRAREEFAALEDRIKATKETLERVGADPRMFRVIDQQLAIALSNLRDFDEEVEKGLNDPIRLDGLERSLEQIQKTIFRELGQNQSLLRNLSKERQEELARESRALDRAAQERLLTQRQSFSREFQLRQAADAQNLAETRIAGQRQIQAERQTQRTRIELLRFALQQIRAIEKGIGSIFSGTARTLGAGLGGVAAVANRLTSIFRRNTRDMNDGLRGALIQRESSISRSFRSQSTTINRELRQQSIALDRFEARANTGVIGALSGRSRVGTALGLGAGIGGGFALFQGIRNGFNVGGDFVQGLAVLQAQLELTDEQMAAVRQQSIALGNDISLPGVSALDAAQAIQLLSKQFASLGSAALPSAQAAAKGVLQLSRAAGVQAEEAARVVGAAVNIFGVEADKATAIADQITNALTLAAGVAFNDFADAFTQSASVVNLFIGPAQEATAATAEFNAAIAVLAKGGLIGSDAGTSLKQFFLQANRGTKDATEAMAGLVDRAGVTGTAFFDASGNARTLSETVDILRRGVKGLSDQARTNIFQKLFGSDAARAGAILVDLGGNFDQLVDKIERQGAAARIAAAQNVGLRGALDALGSVIETQQIKTYEKYQGVLGRVVLAFADLLNKFFEGVGVFGVIRDGLLGVAAALGGLLVVKGVAEGFQFFAVALRAVATPLGLVVTGLVALGAAFAVLRRVSPEFRAEADEIGRALRSRLADGIRFVAAGLAIVSRFLRTEVLPRFIEFGLVVIRTVIPAMQAFANLAMRVLVPAIGAVREAWSILLNGDFTGVGPWEEDSPVVDALFRFRSIVTETIDAIRDVWTIFTGGGTSGVGVGPWDADSPVVAALYRFRDIVASVVADVGGLFGSIIDFIPKISGDQIVAALGVGALGTLLGGPIGGAIAAAVTLAITSINFSTLGQRIVDGVIPQLGSALTAIGSFLASRTSGIQGFLVGPFQAAVGQIGFALGNIVSDPRLIRALAKIAALAALTAVNFVKGFLSGLASNLPELTNDLAALIDAAFNGALRQAFSRPLEVGKFLAAGLVASSVIRAFRRSGAEAGGGFLSGFSRSISTGVRNITGPLMFGGPGDLESLAAGRGRATAKAFQAEFAKTNRDLGLLGVDPVSATGPQGRSSLGTFMSRTVTEADVIAARQRLQSVKDKFGELPVAATIARGRLRSGFRGMVDDFNDLSLQMGSKGRAIGSALGVGIVSGVAAALAGQQLGSATSAGGRALGLAGIIGAALIPLATLPPTLGVPLAVATAGLGLLTAAFSDNDKAAEDAEKRVAAYVDTLKQFKTVADSIPTLAESITDTLLQQSSDVSSFLQRSGFSVTDFVKQVAAGQGSLAGIVRDLTRDLGVDQRRVAALFDSALANGRDAKDVLDDLDKAARGRTASTQATALINEFKGGKAEAQAFVDILDTLFQESGDLLTGLGENALRDDLLTSKDAAVALREEVDRLQDSINRNAGTVQIPLTGTFIAAQASAISLKANIDAVTQAVNSLNQTRTDTINQSIGLVTAQLQVARDAASAAIENVIALVSGDLFGSAQQQFDQLLLSIPQVGTALADAVKGDAENGVPGIPIDKLIDFQSVGGAELRSRLAPFSTAVQNVVRQAINDGVTSIEGPGGLRELLGPIATEIKNLDVPQPVKDEMINQINGFLNSDALKVGLNQITVTSEAASQLQDELDSLNSRLQVKIEFNPQQVAAELRRLQGLGLFSGTIPSPAEIAAAQAAAQAASQPRATSPGTADAAERSATKFTIEQLNIYETTSARATASEATRSFRAAAAAGVFGQKVAGFTG